MPRVYTTTITRHPAGMLHAGPRGKVAHRAARFPQAQAKAQETRAVQGPTAEGPCVPRYLKASLPHRPSLPPQEPLGAKVLCRGGAGPSQTAQTAPKGLVRYKKNKTKTGKDTF